jgi:hypothetical protein
MAMPITTSIPKFERFFRLAASLDIDKADFKRYEEFINTKLRDLVVRAEAIAKANTRDIIMPFDLPITRGLQDRMHEFRKLDAEVGLKSELDHIVKRPPTDFEYFEDTEGELVWIAGGLTLALARSFRIVDPDLKNPMTEHWDRAYALYDLLL